MRLQQLTNIDYVIEDQALESVAGVPLFYPSSGNDLVTPTMIFGTTCKHLHFADIGYFGNDAMNLNPKNPLPRTKAKLIDVSERMVDIPESEWVFDPKYRGVQPRVRTFGYLDTEAGSNFHLHLHRRRGPTAMREELDKIGVFFYRRDSIEGGSGTKWLTIDKWPKTRRRRWLIFEVLDRLVDGGLIVTDGAMCEGFRNPYRFFRQLVPRDAASAIAAKNSTQPFSDGLGRIFTCVGAICDRRGCALMWQVTRS